MSKLQWAIARIQDIDDTRTEPYFANQAIGLATDYHILQKGMDIPITCESCHNTYDAAILGECGMGSVKCPYCGTIASSQGEVDKSKSGVGPEISEEDLSPRSVAAVEFWKNNWYKVYPKDGAGSGIYQHHWRGLSEEESGLSEEELLKNDNNSVHGDMRLTSEIAHTLFGFTIFLGTVADVRNGRDLWSLKDQDKLEITFKLPQPINWINVGVDAPYVVEPSGVGATSLKYAKFFAEDEFTYETGTWHRSFIELFISGKKIKGRVTIANADIDGKRVFLINMPQDQKPYSETHKLEDVIKDLKSRGHKFLWWREVGKTPELIKIS